MTEASHSFGVSVSYFVSNPAANLIFIHFHLMIWDKVVGDPTLMYIKVIDQKGRVILSFKHSVSLSVKISSSGEIE